MCLFVYVMRLYTNILRSDHAVLFAAWRQTEWLAECCVPIPPWVEIADSAFSNCRYGYRTLSVHFGLVRFFMAIPTEGRGDAENGVDGAA